MITRILAVLGGILVLILSTPGGANACGISYQDGNGLPASGCGGTAPVIGAGVVAAVVGTIVVGHAIASLASGASVATDPAVIRDALAIAGVAQPGQALAQGAQQASQGAHAANQAITQAQQAARAAGQNSAAAAIQAANQAAALVQPAAQGARAAAQAAATAAQAAYQHAQAAQQQNLAAAARSAADAAATAAQQAATVAERAAQQAQAANRAADAIAHAQTANEAVAAASELTQAAQVASHAAQAAADSATMAAHASAHAQARAQGTSPNFAAGLAQADVHDAALRAAVPGLHVQFANAYVYGDATGFKYLSYENVHGREPGTKTLAGASKNNPGVQDGRPDILVYVGNQIYIYEIKPHTEYGLHQNTRDQIERYVDAYRKEMLPRGVPVDYGPDFPTTTSVDPATGLIYRLFSKPDYPGVIFYALV